MNAPLLSLITFLPLGGAILLVFIPKEERRRLLIAALVFSLVAFVLSVVLAVRFDGSEAGPQFVEDSPGSVTASATISAWTV